MAGNSQIQGQSVASKLVRILDLFTSRPAAAAGVRRVPAQRPAVLHGAPPARRAGRLRRAAPLPRRDYAVGIRVCGSWRPSHPQLRVAARVPRCRPCPALYASAGRLRLPARARRRGGAVHRGDPRPGRTDGFRYGTRFPLRAAAGGRSCWRTPRSARSPEILGRSATAIRRCRPDRLRQLLHIQQDRRRRSASDDDFLAAAAPVFDHAGAAAASIEAVAACPRRPGTLALRCGRSAADTASRPGGAYPPSGNGNPIPAQWR